MRDWLLEQIKDKKRRRHLEMMESPFKHAIQMDKAMLKELEESSFYSWKVILPNDALLIVKNEKAIFFLKERKWIEWLSALTSNLNCIQSYNDLFSHFLSYYRQANQLIARLRRHKIP